MSTADEVKTVYVLQHDDRGNELYGYDFESKEDADRWMAQLWDPARHGYSVRPVQLRLARRACGCCGARHWYRVRPS